MQEENFEVLDEFLKHLAKLKESYDNTPKLRVVNNERLNEFEQAFRTIADIVYKESPDAKIECMLDNELNIGNAVIRIVTDEIVVKNIQEFIKSIQFATNFEIYPLTNGNIQMNILFKGMIDNILK